MKKMAFSAAIVCLVATGAFLNQEIDRDQETKIPDRVSLNEKREPALSKNVLINNKSESKDIVAMDTFFVTSKMLGDENWVRKLISYPLGREGMINANYSVIIHPDSKSIQRYLGQNHKEYQEYHKSLGFDLELVYEKGGSLKYLEGMESINVSDLPALFEKSKFYVSSPIKSPVTRLLIKESMNENSDFSLSFVDKVIDSEYKMISEFGSREGTEMTISAKPYLDYYQGRNFLSENVGRIKITGLSVSPSMPILFSNGFNINGLIESKIELWNEMGFSLVDKTEQDYDEQSFEQRVGSFLDDKSKPKHTLFVINSSKESSSKSIIKDSLISAMKQRRDVYPWNPFSPGDNISIYSGSEKSLTTYSHSKKEAFYRVLKDFKVENYKSYDFISDIAVKIKEMGEVNQDKQYEVIVISDSEIANDEDFAKNIEFTRALFSDYKMKGSPLISVISIGQIKDLHGNSLSGISGGFSTKVPENKEMIRSAIMHAFHVSGK